jgi:hypothetical protein
MPWYEVEVAVVVSDVKAESEEAAEQAVMDNLNFHLKGVEFFEITIDSLSAVHGSDTNPCPDDEDDEADEDAVEEESANA